MDSAGKKIIHSNIRNNFDYFKDIIEPFLPGVTVVWNQPAAVTGSGPNAGRQKQRQRLNIQQSDRIIFSILNAIGNIKEKVSSVKPETVLRWQREPIKRFWTFKPKNRIDRPPVSNEIKQLLLSMKNDNVY